MDNFTDFYKILDISSKASHQEIKRAVRIKRSFWHPDRNKTQNATKMMEAINEASSILSDINKKQAYDLEYYVFHEIHEEKIKQEQAAETKRKEKERKAAEALRKQQEAQREAERKTQQEKQDKVRRRNDPHYNLQCLKAEKAQLLGDIY